MNSEKKARIIKITFILNAFLFLLGGIDLIELQQPIFGSLHLLAGFSNLLLVITFKNEILKKKLNYLVLIFNIIVATTIAINCFNNGKQYIQYAWILAALLSLLVLLTQLKQQKS